MDEERAVVAQQGVATLIQVHRCETNFSEQAGDHAKQATATAAAVLDPVNKRGFIKTIPDKYL